LRTPSRTTWWTCSTEPSSKLAQGATAAACETLKSITADVESEKGKAIAHPAAERLQRETKTLRSHLGCG
jgi:hypothetical protein